MLGCVTRVEKATCNKEHVVVLMFAYEHHRCKNQEGALAPGLENSLPLTALHIQVV